MSPMMIASENVAHGRLYKTGEEFPVAESDVPKLEALGHKLASDQKKNPAPDNKKLNASVNKAITNSPENKTINVDRVETKTPLGNNKKDK